MYKPTLLYAEDDQDIRENLTLILRGYFDTVYLAEDGEEALTLYREKKPDILLLDIVMPRLDGLDLAKIIREHDPDIPIILLSAYSDREKLLEAVSLKLEAYLLKPVNDALFQETIKNLCKRMQTKESITLRENLVWDAPHSNLVYKGELVKITKKERLLLELLMNHVNTYVTHDQLIFHIWDNDIPDHSYHNKLIQLIYRLNKKMTEILSSDIHLIENSYTLGYRISCQ